MNSSKRQRSLAKLNSLRFVTEDDDLRRTLQSLACGKKRVLSKKPRGPDVNDGDTFSYNAAFEDPAYRVRIPSFQEKETVRHGLANFL